MTESITVLFLIGGEEATSVYPNAMVIQVAQGKEVFLIDVLAALPPHMGHKYSYWARRGAGGGAGRGGGGGGQTSSYLPLPSPSSVIPVTGSFIFLYLEPSDC